LKQEVYVGIIITIVIVIIIIVSLIKKITWLAIIGGIIFLIVSGRTSIIWLALGYEKPPVIEAQIEVPESIELPEIELPENSLFGYEIDNSKFGFGMDGILD